MTPNQVIPGAVVRHQRTLQEYVILSLGKMRCGGMWITAARYVDVNDPAHENEYYRALNEFDNFTLVRKP